MRPINDPETILSWTKDLNIGDKFNNQQLRPNIVWFGEEVPAMERALTEVSKANQVIIIGTSMQVYPAASLVQYAPLDAQIYYIDPQPSINFELSMRKNILIIAQSATLIKIYFL